MGWPCGRKGLSMLAPSRASRLPGACALILVSTAAFSNVAAWVGGPSGRAGRCAGCVPRQASMTWKWESKLGEGSFKVAYMAEIIGDGDYYGHPVGQKLVMKVVKPTPYNSGVRISDKDIAAQKLGAEYAKLFVAEHRPHRGGEPLQVLFRVGELVQSPKEFQHNGKTQILKDENMLIELPIYGDFEKFNSNTGWSSKVGLLPDAFSHWTWVHSNGKHLICDLQGHRGVPNGIPLGDETCNYYIFTDPAVLSRDGSYGSSDLGLAGQETWFHNHVCNDFCRSLGLEGKVPKGQNCLACQSPTLYKPA